MIGIVKIIKTEKEESEEEEVDIGQVEDLRFKKSKHTYMACKALEWNVDGRMDVLVYVYKTLKQ